MSECDKQIAGVVRKKAGQKLPFLLFVRSVDLTHFRLDSYLGKSLEKQKLLNKPISVFPSANIPGPEKLRRFGCKLLI